MNYTYIKLRLLPFLWEWASGADAQFLLQIIHRYGLSGGMCIVLYCSGLTGSQAVEDTVLASAPALSGTRSSIVLNDDLKMLICPRCYGLERFVFKTNKPLIINKLRKYKYVRKKKVLPTVRI